MLDIEVMDMDVVPPPWLTFIIAYHNILLTFIHLAMRIIHTIFNGLISSNQQMHYGTTFFNGVV